MKRITARFSDNGLPVASATAVFVYQGHGGPLTLVGDKSRLLATKSASLLTGFVCESFEDVMRTIAMEAGLQVEIESAGEATMIHA